MGKTIIDILIATFVAIGLVGLTIVAMVNYYIIYAVLVVLVTVGILTSLVYDILNDRWDKES